MYRLKNVIVSPGGGLEDAGAGAGGVALPPEAGDPAGAFAGAGAGPVFCGAGGNCRVWRISTKPREYNA